MRSTVGVSGRTAASLNVYCRKISDDFVDTKPGAIKATYIIVVTGDDLM